MQTILLNVLGETLQITFLVLVMMTAVDVLNVWTRGRIARFLKHGAQWRQYIITSFIGSVPGCVGGFTNVSLYTHGMISFGALVGSMAAASGDEAFVMLSLVPKTALVLFALLFASGIVVAWVTDRMVKTAKIRICENCGSAVVHAGERGLVHYVTEHVWRHIIRKHLWKTSLWTFGALLIVELGMQFWHINAISSQYIAGLLVAGALIGLIPESGPHLIFVTLYANGLIPFSVLFTSSFVQDGHSMLPMLSYSVKDSLLIKLVNLIFGLSIGLVLFAFGV